MLIFPEYLHMAPTLDLNIVADPPTPVDWDFNPQVAALCQPKRSLIKSSFFFFSTSLNTIKSSTIIDSQDRSRFVGYDTLIRTHRCKDTFSCKCFSTTQGIHYPETIFNLGGDLAQEWRKVAAVILENVKCEVIKKNS